MGRRLASVLVAGLLAACNPLGLQPVDDTGDDDTGGDTGTAELIGILVTPDRAAVPLGGELQLVATGLRDDRTSVDVTALATWGSDHPEVADVSDELDSEGLLTGVSVGQAEVFADVDGIRSPLVKVTVTDATLLGLSIQPEELTVAKNEVAHLKAEAAFSDGTRSDASAQVIWVTGNADVVTLATGGTLTAVDAGSTTVHAEWEGKSSPDVPVTVVAQADPDLQVTSVEVESTSGSATITVKVKNDGNTGASDFWVDLFIDPVAPPGAGSLGDHYTTVPYADAGQEVELTFTVEDRAGDHEIWVVADLDDSVAESDEDDNAFHDTFTFGSGVVGPNLEVSWFDYYSDATQIFYVIDVYNGGSEDVGQFYVDLWIDSATDPTSGFVGDEFRDFEGLAAGATEYVDIVVQVSELDAGFGGCASCTSWVKVDTNDNVDETDETDNTAGPIEVEVP